MKENELLAVITCESHAPVSEVEVWLKASRLVHVTVSPTRTVIVAGANAEFWIFAALVAASATSGSASKPPEMTRAAAHAAAARLMALLYGPCRPR